MEKQKGELVRINYDKLQINNILTGNNQETRCIFIDIYIYSKKARSCFLNVDKYLRHVNPLLSTNFFCIIIYQQFIYKAFITSNKTALEIIIQMVFNAKFCFQRVISFKFKAVIKNELSHTVWPLVMVRAPVASARG